MNSLPAITGWLWLKQGAGLFRKQPAALTTLLFANILVSIGISAVPLLGPMVAVVLIPSFSMAFMKACLMIENGERVSPAVLLTGFRKPVVLDLCKVGLIYLGVSLLMALVTRFAVDPGFWEQVARQGREGGQPQVAGSDVLAMFAIFGLDVAALMALCFAAPLTYWQKMGPGKAVFYSFFAVVRSARVFIVLLLAWFAIFFGICMVVTLLLGTSNITRVVIMWLIFLFILLLQCAMYAGYRQIFGKPADGGAGKVSLDK
ncbi:BPSS1780 family membrane protein [Massilia sp. H6]|uniref:BPSS1780 family membrane protein n=1 Tax=Massilia sp. H6 TaxID=2970464 RepID=UPI002169D091|nr:BPSS1780 family membrane protein [Massilia sp. H6]UVW29448.1 BPSS1780 family membrane protein [Massilia sp. H6]